MIYPSLTEAKIRQLHEMPDLTWSGDSFICALTAIFGSLSCRPFLRVCKNNRLRCAFVNAVIGGSVLDNSMLWFKVTSFTVTLRAPFSAL
jgi:hypothetical protein